MALQPFSMSNMILIKCSRTPPKHWASEGIAAAEWSCHTTGQWCPWPGGHEQNRQYNLQHAVCIDFCYISAKLKPKIWASEFVQLDELLQEQGDRTMMLSFNPKAISLVPKSSKSGAMSVSQWSLTQHLFHPVGSSISDGIPSEKALVQYQTINYIHCPHQNHRSGCIYSKNWHSSSFLNHTSKTFTIQPQREFTGEANSSITVVLPWVFSHPAAFLNSWVQCFTG